jgi:hypothetical protein
MVSVNGNAWEGSEGGICSSPWKYGYKRTLAEPRSAEMIESYRDTVLEAKVKEKHVHG